MEILYGPLTLVLDSYLENQLWGVGLTVLCLAAFAWAVVRPRPLPLGLAMAAAILWLIVGRLGGGINC